MRSFAVIAGLAASANALAYGYEAYNTTSVAPPTYPAASTPAGYAVSSAAGYASYPSYTTTTVKGLTTVCPEATTLKVGSKTYTVTKSTTIIDDDCEYTTTVPVVKSTPVVKASSTPVVVKGSSTPVVVKASSTPVVVKGSSTPVVAKSSGVPVNTPVVPYTNGTTPTYAVGTGSPTSTKSTPSQFTGAAAQTGAAMLAIVGAVAAFL